MNLQGDYKKYCYFSCLWTSRAKEGHCKKKDWPFRDEYIPGKMNTKHKLYLMHHPQKNVLPSLHIKLSLAKNSVEALEKTNVAFKHLWSTSSGLSEAKLKDRSANQKNVKR